MADMFLQVLQYRQVLHLHTALKFLPCLPIFCLILRYGWSVSQIRKIYSLSSTAFRTQHKMHRVLCGLPGYLPLQLQVVLFLIPRSALCFNTMHSSCILLNMYARHPCEAACSIYISACANLSAVSSFTTESNVPISGSL